MDRLQRAIALITDGQSVDWEGLLEDTSDPAERQLLAELRGLAQLDADRPFLADHRLEDSLSVPSPRAQSLRRRWGHLELLDELGSGAYGVVYRAWDTRLAREVALKLLYDTDAARSLEEARRLARVSHPNVVTVYGADRIDGQVGLWMELLKGHTLDQILAAQGTFSAREATVIGVEICGAVAAIHAAGLIHRDVKAQNVVREPGGRLVLMDMGASVAAVQDDAAVTSLAGTPLYMAPELFEGAAPSPASDVYAIGVLLYRLVSAEFPVHEATLGALRHVLAYAPVRSLRDARPTLPAGLIAVIDTCMSHNPSDRYAAASDLERALLAIDRPALPARANTWTPPLALAFAAITGAGLAWTFAGTPLLRPSSVAETAIAPEHYKLYSGYEELGFAKHEEDPRGTIAATTAAMDLIRSPLAGNHPVYALLYSRLADTWRRLGDTRQAAEAARDAATHMLESAGDDHPFAAVVAMEQARNALASHEFKRAAEDLQRALFIRSRLLDLPGTSANDVQSIDIASLERAVRTASLTDDGHGDGILDALALLRDQRSRERDHAGEHEPERRATDRLLLGWHGSPFLSWAQSGILNPRSSGWQPASNFPLGEAPRFHAWSIVARHSLGFFHQRLSLAQSARAVQRGFSALLRGAPVRGLITFSIDLASAGPRLDLLVRRVDARSIEVRLPSSIVPREGPTVLVESPVDARSPVLELRYDPRSQQAALYQDGHFVTGHYAGHRQFQNPAEGTVSWGVAALGDGDTSAEAAFSLVWLEIF